MKTFLLYANIVNTIKIRTFNRDKHILDISKKIHVSTKY